MIAISVVDGNFISTPLGKLIVISSDIHLGGTFTAIGANDVLGLFLGTFPLLGRFIQSYKVRQGISFSVANSLYDLLLDLNSFNSCDL